MAKRPPTGLPLRHAALLGLVQGPTELLPVSSSAHTTLIPLLLDWPYAELDPELRKSFEVALHAGAGIALALDMRAELLAAARELDSRRAGVVALSLLPPALAGLLLRPLIERRLAGARSIAAGLVLGGLAMAAADRNRRPRGRPDEDARPADGLALGLAQAVALAPGVSRYGATLSAARARGFSTPAAQSLSWHAALPVMLGASALEGLRLARRPPPAGTTPALVLGAGVALLSTRLSARLLRRSQSVLRTLLPFSLYRLLIAALVLIRTRRHRTSQPSSIEK
ncbi:MAG TPA: undecaprenyl-diphosphate phosphatase [Solirubrobacteraceae bacterium]|jgi:undecaprenyl-diphosphatase|nr:undecaprenyl-diphosphate phosphatase [Solirubrobacteraceae bacterium]